MSVDAKKFNEWFTAQFGKRPSHLPLSKLADTELYHRQAHFQAQALLESTRQWDNQFNDCLYAWTAAQKEHTT
jgi:hypothetical protein